MSEQALMRVSDVMKKNYDVVDGKASVRQALELMQYIETKCLVVNKAHEHDEYGMVLLSDIARDVLAANRSPDRVSIYEIMMKPAITVHPDMDIRYASALFSRFGISRAPVVDAESQIIGIVSYTDMVMKGMLKLI